LNMLYNPNRYVSNVDDIYGVHRVNMMGTIILPGTDSFYSKSMNPIPVTTPIIWASSYVKDTSSPENWNPDTSDEVFN
jgi:hypothetical protein